SACVLDQPFALGPGSYAFAIEFVGLQPAYSDGDGTNETFANRELAFRAGAATPAAFAGPVASPRVFNGAIWYSPGGTPLPLAIDAPFGAACNTVQGTFSELFAAVPGQRTFDLDNSTLHLLPNAQGGYDVTRTAGAPIVPPGVQALGLGDDTLSIEFAPFPFPFPGGSTDDIWVSSNGFLAFEPTAVADFSPTEAELLAQGARLCPAWMDFNPGAPGSGNVHYEIDPANTFVTITWNNVWQYGTTAASRFQVVLRQN